MPPEVYWTKRTDDQVRHDVIPLPNFHLLPKELWHLYPFIFSKKTTVTQQFAKISDVVDIQVSKSKPKCVPQPSDEASKDASMEQEVVIIEDVNMESDNVTRPEAAKSPEDHIIENIMFSENQPTGFDALKERETIRKKGKKRKIVVENELEKNTSAPSFGKNQLRGVITTTQANSSLVSFSFSFFLN